MSVASPLQAAPAKAQASVASTASGLLQRKCACGSPTSSLTGECAECKTKKRLQTKLAIGASNDPLEREADRIADQVLAAPARAAVSGTPPRIQRYTGRVAGPAENAPASVDHTLASPGRPLEPALRQDMEQRFGHDFSRVRVHSGAAAEQSAHDVNANAYTVGHNMVFDAGRFAPGTHEGRRLIAHELAHVVQQSGADGNSVRQNNENCGTSAISQPVAQGRAVARTVQRQPAPPAEIEYPAEYAFALDERKRTWRRYARSLGRMDAARIRKSGKLSSEDREEVNAKLRFFEGQALAAYIQEIKPALVEVTREEIEIPAESASTSPSVGPKTQELTCDIGQKQFLLQYEGEPAKNRCMDIRTDPEFENNLFDANIASAVGYAVEGTTWENVEYDRFNVMLVKYKNGSSEYFMLNDVPNFYYGHTSRILLEYTYLKRKNGLVYPVYKGQIYFSEILTPNMLAYKNGLKYQIKDLQSLYTLLQVAGAFAGIIASYTLVVAFKASLQGFRRSKRLPATTTKPALPAPQYKMVTKVYKYSGRKIVVLELPSGQKQAFYKRAGDSTREEGHVGAKVGEWAPFDGFKPQPGGGQFYKEKYFQVPGSNPLYSYGTAEKKAAAIYLNSQNIPDVAESPSFGEIGIAIKSAGAPAPYN